MGSVFGELVPMILGNILAPLWLIIVLLMLESSGGVVRAFAFVMGMTFTRVMQGVLFGMVLGSYEDASASSGPSPVASTLKLVLGILLLVAAVKKWRKEEDPDDPPPKWMESLGQITPLKAFGFGALGIAVGVKLWAFTLSAIAVISAAELAQSEAITAYAAYVFFAQILLFLAILISAVAREGSRALLKRAIDWLTTYNRPISITVALVFGVFFAWGGISGLLGI